MSDSWKILRPPRARALTAGAIVGVALAACAPAERVTGARERLADGDAGSARVITVVRMMQPGAVVGTVGYADTTTAPVMVSDGSAGVDLTLLQGKPRVPNPGDQRLYSVAPRDGAGGTLEVARDGRHATRQGRWTREARLADGRVASFELAAAGGAPVSELTVRVGGEVVSSETRRWVRAEGGAWALASRVLTVFRDGRAIGSVEMQVEVGPLRLASAAERLRTRAGGMLRASVLAAADVLAPAPLFAQAMSGPCAKEANTTLDALKDYEASVAILGGAMLSLNPFATAAAAVNVLRNASKVDDAEARLDLCVAQA